MEEGKKLLILNAIICCLYTAGVLIFAKGFLLNRVEIHTYSECRQDKPSVMIPNKNSYESETEKKTSSLSCVQNKRFEKAIFIIIDALRYDFVKFNTDVSIDNAKPYENKLPIFYELLSSKPENALLFKFLADPPTTTMQRLKGLTTGSLPTFIDAGQNFASSEIGEDSFIEQLHRATKNITFMGDDTWESLFKGKFSKSFAFPSFNVKDLHTVDNGCISHLGPEIRKNDWNVLIAHFLGVDHCGHRYGPDHIAMTQKLLQMNDVMSSVVDMVQNDTILFVLGDHGMTRTGDHGGDSADEVGAALFVYSPAKLIEKEKNNFPEDKTVSQIDLVPTLSLLLGLPIPFSNLGQVIPELFSTPSLPLTQVISDLNPDELSAFSEIMALGANAIQVREYIHAYAELTGAFAYRDLIHLETLFEEADHLKSELIKKVSVKRARGKVDTNSAQKLLKVHDIYVKYLTGVRAMCHKIWAQFDDFAIDIGMGIFLGTLLINVLMLFFSRQIRVGCILILAAYTIFPWISVENFFTKMVTSLAMIALLWTVTNSNQDILVQWMPSSPEMLESVLPITLAIIHALSLTSNSFVINESHIVTYFSQSVITFILIWKFLHLKHSERKKTKLKMSSVIIVAFLTLLFLLCSRLGIYFWSCREEQYWCDVSIFFKSLAKLRQNQESYPNLRYIFSVSAISIPPSLLYFWLHKQGNVQGSYMRMFPVKYGLPVATMCICFYWGLQSIPFDILDSLPDWQQTFLPRIAYFFFFLAVLAIIFDPICAFVLPVDEQAFIHEHLNAEKAANSTTRSSNAKKRRSNKRPEQRQNSNGDETNTTSSEPPVPIVCGLATVYSSNFLQLLVVLVLFLGLLLGDGLAPSVTLMLFHMFVTLEIGWRISSMDQIPVYQVWMTCVWSFLALQYFFSTGHQTVISSIRFEAAFIGYHGDYSTYLYWIPMVLILLNTFASQVLFAAALPLMFVWPMMRSHPNPLKKDVESLGRELLLQAKPEQMRFKFCNLICQYLAFQGFQLFGTMLSASIHRRHLMAWSIFAPRFIFQGVSFLMVIPSLLVSSLIFLHIHWSMGSWVSRYLS